MMSFLIFLFIMIESLALGQESNPIVVQSKCLDGDPLCTDIGAEAPMPKSPPRTAAPAVKKETPARWQPHQMATVPKVTPIPSRQNGRGKPHTPNLAELFGEGDGKDTDGLKQSQDGQGNWIYDFSKADPLHANTVYCSTIRERPLGVKFPIPCFDEYMEIFGKDAAPTADQAAAAFGKMLRCFDSCVTVQDSQFLAKCFDFQDVVKPLKSVDDETFDFGAAALGLFKTTPSKKGNIGRCTKEQIQQAILTNEYSGAHRTKNGGCERPNLGQYQFGRWEDAVILISNSRALATTDAMFNYWPVEAWQKDKLTWLHEIIAGYQDTHQRFAPTTKLIIVDQTAGRPAWEINIHDPNLVKKADAVVASWVGTFCDPNCVDLVPATLSKLSRFTRRLKTGQKLFDANKLDDYTITLCEGNPKADSVNAQLLTTMMTALPTEVARAKTSARVQSRILPQRPLLIPEPLKLDRLEIEVDGQTVAAENFTIDPKTRMLTFKKNYVPTELHLVNLRYKAMPAPKED